MGSLKMQGPYRLDASTITDKITRISPGNYALGRLDQAGTFMVSYIGRADADLISELKAWISKTSKPLFKFQYADSAHAAYIKECEIYHDFLKERKDKHPHRPEGTDWNCPRCQS